MIFRFKNKSKVRVLYMDLALIFCKKSKKVKIVILYDIKIIEKNKIQIIIISIDTKNSLKIT